MVLSKAKQKAKNAREAKAKKRAPGMLGWGAPHRAARRSALNRDLTPLSPSARPHAADTPTTSKQIDGGDPLALLALDEAMAEPPPPPPAPSAFDAEVRRQRAELKNQQPRDSACSLSQAGRVA